jgi:hypothetical protein
MESKRIFGEIKNNNTQSYQHHVTINSKPVFTGFGVTLSKNYYMWLSTSSSAVDTIEFCAFKNIKR